MARDSRVDAVRSQATAGYVCDARPASLDDLWAKSVTYLLSFED